MLDAWADNAAVTDVVGRASAALGQDLAALISSGPAEALNLTTNTQPAMWTSGAAAYRARLAAGGRAPALVAGHSLGEDTALTPAGALAPAGACHRVRVWGIVRADG